MIQSSKANNDALIFFKTGYNAALKRIEKADHYLNTHAAEDCLKLQKFNDRDQDLSIINLYSEIIKELSVLIQEIEKLTQEKLTHDVKINGFQEVRQ